jgi:hypothetical protein
MTSTASLPGGEAGFVHPPLVAEGTTLLPGHGPQKLFVDLIGAGNEAADDVDPATLVELDALRDGIGAQPTRL